MNTDNACSIIRDLINNRISTRKHATGEIRVALMTLLSATYVTGEADDHHNPDHNPDHIDDDDADTEITCFTSERRRECCPGCGLLLEGRSLYRG